MTVPTFALRPQLCSRGLRLEVIKIIETPPVGVRIALRVFDGHIGAVELPGEEAATRSFRSGSIRILPWKHELKLLQKDGPFRKNSRFLVDVVGAWLDVDVMKLRKICLSVI